VISGREGYLSYYGIGIDDGKDVIVGVTGVKDEVGVNVFVGVEVVLGV
jgi:hypothetical protein